MKSGTLCSIHHQWPNLKTSLAHVCTHPNTSAVRDARSGSGYRTNTDVPRRLGAKSAATSEWNNCRIPVPKFIPCAVCGTPVEVSSDASYGEVKTAYCPLHLGGKSPAPEPTPTPAPTPEPTPEPTPAPEAKTASPKSKAAPKKRGRPKKKPGTGSQGS